MTVRRGNVEKEVEWVTGGVWIKCVDRVYNKEKFGQEVILGGRKVRIRKDINKDK